MAFLSEDIEMSRLFIIGDTHFGHNKVVEFRKISESVRQHDLILIYNINITCKSSDTLILLGDVAFNKEAFHRAMQNIQCKKHFVLGNHDKWSVDLYRSYGKVSYNYIKHGVIYTHIPIHPSQLVCNGGRWNTNVHAHLHDKPDLGTGYSCVSAERVNYTPTQIN